MQKCGAAQLTGLWEDTQALMVSRVAAGSAAVDREEEDERKDHFVNAEFRSLFCINHNAAFPEAQLTIHRSTWRF